MLPGRDESAGSSEGGGGMVTEPSTYQRTVGRRTHCLSGFGKKMIIIRDWLAFLLKYAVVQRSQASSLLICWRFWSISAGCILFTIGAIGHASSTLRCVHKSARGYLWDVWMLSFSVCALPRGPVHTIFFRSGGGSMKSLACCLCRPPSLVILW